MKAYIHTHDNPEIPWPMALYREPKPEPIYSRLDDEKYLAAIDEWQSESHLAYIKEPGFKVGDEVCVKASGMKGKIEKWKRTGSNIAIVRFNKFDKREYNTEYLSHYHERQEIPLEKFKYVRRKPIKGKPKKTAHEIWKIAKKKNLSDQEYKKLLIDNKIIVKTEWQEVKEPEETKEAQLYDSENDDYYNDIIDNPDRELFHQLCREATILLEEI